MGIPRFNTRQLLGLTTVVAIVAATGPYWFDDYVLVNAVKALLYLVLIPYALIAGFFGYLCYIEPSTRKHDWHGPLGLGGLALFAGMLAGAIRLLLTSSVFEPLNSLWLPFATVQIELFFAAAFLLLIVVPLRLMSRNWSLPRWLDSAASVLNLLSLGLVAGSWLLVFFFASQQTQGFGVVGAIVFGYYAQAVAAALFSTSLLVQILRRHWHLVSTAIGLTYLAFVIGSFVCSELSAIEHRRMMP